MAAAMVMALGCSDDSGTVGSGGTAGAGGVGGVGGGGGAGPQAVSIAFAAVVGAEAFTCGNTYDDLGASGSSLQLSDFRFFVQDVELRNDEGDYVAVTLDDDAWQAEGASLLDFEDGCNDLGTVPTHTVVTGTVPAGTYDGLRFQVGVPFEPNHANPSTAPSPLNLTSMHWNWQGGYKFIRIDSGSFSMTDWRMHLGSTGCDGDPISGGTTACSTPNRIEVDLASFDPESDTVVADFAELVAGAELDVNQEMTPVGCMAGPSDGDCAPLFDNLGLGFGGAEPSGPQRVFSVQ
jgi:uncharacterized repeat protein (TIGR04052 family)